MLTVAGAVEFLERLAPPALAAAWDNVGLLLGDPAAPVQRIMTCLTITPDNAAEAIEEGVHLIVTHHPILFRPVQRLTTATPQGRMLLALTQARVAVYSPHTAFDNACGGINEILARRLELIDIRTLRQREGPRQCKLIVFVPDADLGRVSDALFAAGAGHIGQYSQCSFRLAGTGTFFGSENTQPTVGQKGRREEVSEWRLEVVCSEARVASVVAAMRRAHSYEEPAYDVYPLQAPSSLTGEGRLGSLPQALPLRQLAEKVKTHLRAGLVQMVGDPARPVQRLALVCGSGSDFLEHAVRAGADTLLTGETRFHDYLTARAEGLALILPGHYASERPGMEELAGRLQREWAELQVWASRREQDPLLWC